MAYLKGPILPPPDADPASIELRLLMSAFDPCGRGMVVTSLKCSRQVVDLRRTFPARALWYTSLDKETERGSI